MKKVTLKLGLFMIVFLFVLSGLNYTFFRFCFGDH